MDERMHCLCVSSIVGELKTVHSQHEVFQSKKYKKDKRIMEFN